MSPSMNLYGKGECGEHEERLTIALFIVLFFIYENNVLFIAYAKSPRAFYI